MIGVGPLHFLRPGWLLALLALPLLAWWLRRAMAARADWQRAIDPHLLPHLLVPGAGARRRGVALLAMLAYAATVIALAGPAWRQVEQPAWQARLPMVIAVDLSSASLATDVAPSRQAQLRARLSRLLQGHRDGPIALVAFADDAFTVAPLTDDAANVALFVDALQPDVMPVDGQSPARAIDWSRQLIERAGYRRGRIVLVTDHADAAAQRSAAAAREAGDVVSALGLGTPAGANVPTAAGDAHVALDEDSLRALARAGGGRYARLSLEGRDAAVFATAGGSAAQQGGTGARTWSDEGFRLVPLVMLLALVVLVRRPCVAAAVLLLVLLPRPSLASDLWLRPDQRTHRAVVEGVDLYRRGDFARAADAFARADTADAHYDRGNALAKAGRLEEAVKAYDAALARQPGMPDAAANRRAVLQALQRRQQGKGNQSGREGGASKQSEQPRDCTQGDAACRSQSSPQPPRNAGKAALQPSATPPRPQDATRQAQADAAQRERMQRALQTARAQQAQAARMSPAQRERKLSDDAALARVPDEPGSLLREKFRLEHERRQSGDGPR